jgi:NAD(P)-dependent dehydrogenase (short-subunit alcohol dehydrogenase family)
MDGERGTRGHFDLSGRAAIVTGGATGIGLQMATALAEAGADVAICARDAARCEAAAADLARFGTRTLGLGCNVADPDAVEAMASRTLEAFGRVDVLVNNAGTSWGAPTETYPLSGWQKVLDVNLTGTFLCTQAIGRSMLSAGRGKVINIASVAGLIGSRPEVREAIAYTAAKGGVLALTRDLACQWGPRGVTVNAIAPGYFRTAMTATVVDRAEELILADTPLGRLGGDHDLQGVVVFLAASASDYLTGQTLVVDGGRSIC